MLACCGESGAELFHALHGFGCDVLAKAVPGWKVSMFSCDDECWCFCLLAHGSGSNIFHSIMNLTLLANTQSRVLGHACRHSIAYPLKDIVTKSMGRVLVPGSSKILVWYENGLLLMYSRRRELMEGEGGKIRGRSWKRRKVEPKLRKAKFGRLPSSELALQNSALDSMQKRRWQRDRGRHRSDDGRTESSNLSLDFYQDKRAM